AASLSGGILRARPAPAQPDHRELRRWPGGRGLAGRGPERGARHPRGRDRTLPDPAGLPDPHRARTHGLAQGLAASWAGAQREFGIGVRGFGRAVLILLPDPRRTWPLPECCT